MPEILEEVKALEENTKRQKLELSKLCWYMRGSLSLEEAYYTSPEDREVMGKLVEENLETTKKTQMPFF